MACCRSKQLAGWPVQLCGAGARRCLQALMSEMHMPPARPGGGAMSSRARKAGYAGWLAAQALRTWAWLPPQAPHREGSACCWQHAPRRQPPAISNQTQLHKLNAGGAAPGAVRRRRQSVHKHRPRRLRLRCGWKSSRCSTVPLLHCCQSRGAALPGLTEAIVLQY